MGWEWLPTVVNTMFQVLEVAAVAGVASVCPPLAPVVGGCLAVGGAMVGQELTKAVDGEQTQGYAHGIYDQQLKDLEYYAQNNDENIRINQEMLKDIKDMILFNADESREIMKDMKNSLTKFEHNMNANFDALKGFIVEKDFIKETKQPIDLMWHHMQNASSYMTKYTVDLFLENYRNQGQAKFIFEKFVHGLGDMVTNPISTAIENAPANSSQIATYYMHLISEMAVKVFAIEGFYQGLTMETNNDTTEYMEEFSAHMESLITQLKHFFINYKLPTEKYWPDLVNITANSENYGEELDLIADGIKLRLDRIYTRDIFTIHVFNCPMHTCHVYNPLPKPDSNDDPYEETPLIVKDINKETYAIILRSENHRHVSEADKARLEAAYILHYKWSLKWDGDVCDKKTWNDLGEAINDVFHDKAARPYGFVICGVTDKIEQRLTNGTSNASKAPIFAEATQPVVDNQFYFGLSWR